MWVNAERSWMTLPKLSCKGVKYLLLRISAKSCVKIYRRDWKMGVLCEMVGNFLNCSRLVWEDLKRAAKPDSKENRWTSTNIAEAMAERDLRRREIELRRRDGAEKERDGAEKKRWSWGGEIKLMEVCVCIWVALQEFLSRGTFQSLIFHVHLFNCLPVKISFVSVHLAVCSWPQALNLMGFTKGG